MSPTVRWGACQRRCRHCRPLERPHSDCCLASLRRVIASHRRSSLLPVFVNWCAVYGAAALAPRCAGAVWLPWSPPRAVRYGMCRAVGAPAAPGPRRSSSAAAPFVVVPFPVPVLLGPAAAVRSGGPAGVVPSSSAVRTNGCRFFRLPAPPRPRLFRRVSFSRRPLLRAVPGFAARYSFSARPRFPARRRFAAPSCFSCSTCTACARPALLARVPRFFRLSYGSRRYVRFRLCCLCCGAARCPYVRGRSSCRRLSWRPLFVVAALRDTSPVVTPPPYVAPCAWPTGPPHRSARPYCRCASRPCPVNLPQDAVRCGDRYGVDLPEHGIRPTRIGRVHPPVRCPRHNHALGTSPQVVH
ncbi:hypothetical protein SRIMHP_09020 [Streptomyces rimosus subsp. rimosus]|nr:hypothetical protein SRIMHP_09020 [Streptomyces rimosus subsp. rimosus]UTJ12360.1 hypothetical protein SRIMDV3_08920 [Streptomyces rimosus subsp. rimosus]